MPTAAWFSMLALPYVLAMAGYHGFFLLTRYVLPEPARRAACGWKSVLIELFLTVVVLAPVLRRILPVLTGERGPSAALAASFYVAMFGWLPLMKAAALLALPLGRRKDDLLRVLYSVPMSVLYLTGVGYSLFVTTSMMMVLR